MFVHGGYWQHTVIEMYSFIAKEFYKRKIITILPEYDVCPNGNVYRTPKNNATKIKPDKN